MTMNYEKWHDGIGYDLSALDEMTEADKDSIADLLISDPEEPWRKFEALEHINTPRALAAINEALKHPSLEVRIAASQFAKGIDRERERILIEAIETSEIYGGFSQALDEVETFHPPTVIDALLRSLLKRGDSEAVNIAGMLFYIHGKADSAFDWDHRPLFLRFGEEDPEKRRQVFIEFCRIIGVDPGPYLDR